MTCSGIRQFILAVSVIIAVLACLEGGARLLEAYSFAPPSAMPERPGWQTEYFGSLFEWHEPDPYVLWRFKANIDNPLITTNSRHLLGPEISPDKPRNAYRILILGDSSPVGLGLASRQQTFGHRLRYMLERQWADRKTVEIVNAAVSGYSSEQVVRWMERYGWDYKPDVVVLYCGNNDASISGAFTDRELFAAQKFAGLRSLLSKSALYRVLRCVLTGVGASGRDTGAPLSVRVTPEQYGENLSVIVSECLRRRIPLIALKSPVPYLWPAGLQFKPFLHLSGQHGQILLPPRMAEILQRKIAYCIDKDRFRELYGTGDIFTAEVYRSAYSEDGDPEDIIAKYLTALEHDSLDPAAWNNLGVAYWRQGDYTDAEEAFRAARRAFETRYPDISQPANATALSLILFNRGINLLSHDDSQDIIGYDTTGEAWRCLDSALQCDYFSLRVKRPYWNRIDGLIGTPGVSVIDLPALFSANGGERLFIDHCHPTAEGHILIARALFDTILDRL